MANKIQLMYYLNLLRLTFDTAIEPWQAPDFRAAVMDYLGWGYDGLPLPGEDGAQTTLAKEDSAGLPAHPYPYPLAQFKVRRNRGSYQPMLLFLGPRSSEVREYFRSARNSAVVVNNRAYPLDIAEASLHRFRLKAGEEWFEYNLFKYQALNNENHRRYQELENEEQRLSFLEKLLASHILTFARGVGWQVGAPVQVKGLHILQEQELRCRGIRNHCFDLNFRCNLFLPEFIGLGRGVARGFGVLRLDRRGRN